MPLNKKIILVTGAAGFIGSADSEKLLSENNKVIGIDSINDYYNPLLKRLTDLESNLFDLFFQLQFYYSHVYQ